MSRDSITELRAGGLQIVQSLDGYRFSLDPILLCHFATTGSAEKIIDLGTGSGVIPLLLARLTQASELTGIELQPAQVARAQESIALNGLQQRVKILQADVRHLSQLLPTGQADLVVTNPPYRQPGSGRIAPHDERAAARHELAGGLPDFVTAAAQLLVRRGRFAIIYLAERLAELLTQMAEQKLEPKRLRMIHPRIGEPAKMVLVEGRKDGRPGLVVDAPLVIYRGAEGGRCYSDEVLAMYAEGDVVR